MLYSDYIFLLIAYYTYFTCSLYAEELISRCLYKRREFIYLSCPDTHVIYQPEIFLGVGNRSDCIHQYGDCTGLSYNLMKQKNKCHWSKSCHFSWRHGDVILSSESDQCIGSKPNYVAYINPRCIVKDQIFNICNNHKKMLTSKHGVLRSHQEYPWAYGSTLGTCSMQMKVQPGHQLQLQLDDVQTRHGDYLMISHLVNGSSITLFNATYCKGDTFRITDGLVEFRFVSCPGATIGRGFTIRFEQSLYSSVEAIQPYVKNNSVTKQDEYAIIEECMNHKTDSVKLSCREDELIYKPNVIVGASNYDVCYSKPGDCQGQVHTILTQQNDCYWSNTCEISWTGDIPITMFAYQPCLSLLPSYLKMSKFQCLKRDRVFDICDKSTWEIQQPNGAIKSHVIYPWNYKASTIKCRKRIRVNRRYGLRLFTDDFDLDIDTRKERLNIWHVTPQGHKIKKKKLRGQDRVEIIVTNGCIDLEFKISHMSKTGRGFVMIFQSALQPELNHNAISGFDHCGGKETFFRRKPRQRFKIRKSKPITFKYKKDRNMVEQRGKWKNKYNQRKQRGLNRKHRA